MNEVYLGLGTNEGDREKNLDEALKAIASLPDTRLGKVSGMIRTKAYGFDGPDFLNCCCRIDTELGPRDLLNAVKKIERDMGRTAPPEYDGNGARIYRNRIIDIDILLYGDMEINEDDLTIPHRHMPERDFVMIPLNEIRNK